VSVPVVMIVRLYECVLPRLALELRYVQRVFRNALCDSQALVTLKRVCLVM
jgi:hypothetical protein